MRRPVRSTLFLLIALALAGCASLPQPLTSDDALAMAKAGKHPEDIITAMRASHSQYDLTTAEIIRLHQAGLPEKVIDHMRETQLDAVRAQERQNELRVHWWLGFGRYRRF